MVHLAGAATDAGRLVDDVFGAVFQTRYASAGNTAELVYQADMVIGAVLILAVWFDVVYNKKRG